MVRYDNKTAFLHQWKTVLNFRFDCGVSLLKNHFIEVSDDPKISSILFRKLHGVASKWADLSRELQIHPGIKPMADQVRLRHHRYRCRTK